MKTKPHLLLHTVVHAMLANVARANEYTRDPEDGDEFERHRKALREYLADKRQAQAIDAQVAALQELAAA